MPDNVKRYSRIYLAYGYTDLRFGIDGLARVVQNHLSLDPFQKGCLFLFCSRRTDRIKGLHACHRKDTGCPAHKGCCLSVIQELLQGCLSLNGDPYIHTQCIQL